MKKKIGSLLALLASWREKIILAIALILAMVGAGSTPSAGGAPPLPASSQPGPADELALAQSRIADKYGQLEKLLIRMAAVEAAEHPRRAALLKRAARQSADRLTRSQLNALVRLLNQQQLKRAIDGQDQALTDLQSLLQLLLSENRPDRLKSEQARLRQYIQAVERLIRLQKGLQGRNEGGEDAQRLADEQGKLAERTGRLAQTIQQNEEGKQNANGDPNHQGDESNRPPNENNKQDNQQDKPRPDQHPDAERPPPKDQEKDRPQAGPGQSKSPGGDRAQPGPKNQPSPPGQDAQESQDNAPQAHPARGRLQAAEQRMRDARKKLEEARRKESSEQQERAKEELERAKAELEEILRQLREEEIQRMLALLESRFRKMLEMELKVHETTIQLDKTPSDQRDNSVIIRAGRLAFEQRKIADEADKAHLLLLEEGSSIALPETVDQMREEMQQAADRLAGAKIGKITQAVQEDIIETLEDLIQALQKAQKDKEQQQKDQAPSMDPQDMPLVDQLAEIKMIRALQMRVNTRTKRYAQLLEDPDDPTGQATEEDLRDALRSLADRQDRIHRITRDIVLGKNK